MKHRFETSKRRRGPGGIAGSVVLFAAVLSVFLGGISAVERRTDAQALDNLEQAVRRGIVHCYSMEGAYPESLQYLKDHYGLLYDEERFFVDYRILGSNLVPEVTIMDRRARP